jgi:hypothetical protein
LTTATINGTSVRIVLVALCVVLVQAGPAPGESDLSTAHVSQAVQALFDADRDRIDAEAGSLHKQDIVRQEISVCIDPHEGSLSGRARLWVESPNDHIELLLGKELVVDQVRDSRGDTLEHVRTSDTLTVRAPDGAPSFPLEIELGYGGRLPHGIGARMDDDAVVLGSEYHWYPVSTVRDPARLRIEVRYPSGYSSVATGTLAGMAPSLTGRDGCQNGDIWEAPTPVTGAALVVGRLESSLTVTGAVFLGYHVATAPTAGIATDTAPAGKRNEAHRPQPVSVPTELPQLLRFLESCYGPYPYEWLNVVRLTAERGRPRPVVAGPGLIVFWDTERTGGSSGMPLSRLASALSESWWTFWMDPGRVVSASLSSVAEMDWLDAVGDEEGAATLRAAREARITAALRDSARPSTLLACLGRDALTGGSGVLTDERWCEGKGAAVFEILKSVVGQGAYCTALREIAEAHGGRPVGIGDLAESFERAYGGDLDWFFYEWFCRGDLPTYVIEYDARPVGDGTYVVRGTITQQGEPFRTPVPLTIDLGGWAYDETVAIESSHQSFEIRTDEEPMWITVDERELIPKIDPDEQARMRYKRGAAAAAAGAWDVAVDEFGAAAALEPGNASYAGAYADALVSYGRLADGLEAMERAIALLPRNADMRLEAADLYLRSGDAASALSHADAYLAVRPDDPAGLVERARALVELGRLDEAEAVVERANDLLGDQGISPGLREAMLLVTGRVHELRGELDQAARAYEAALAANPVSDEARRRIRALEHPEQQ